MKKAASRMALERRAAMVMRRLLRETTTTSIGAQIGRTTRSVDGWIHAERVPMGSLSALLPVLRSLAWTLLEEISQIEDAARQQGLHIPPDPAGRCIGRREEAAPSLQGGCAQALDTEMSADYHETMSA